MENESDNPYLAGRREWMERYGDYIAAAARWRTVALLSLLALLFSLAGLVYVGSQQKIVPYVVEVDQLGNEAAVGRADLASPADPRIIRSALARWIVNARTVYGDSIAQRSMVDNAYKVINRQSDAYGQLNDWFSTTNPFRSGVTVEARIQSALQTSPITWRVEWEEIFAEEGGRRSSEEHQATITVQVSPPRDERIAMVNPLGIYITYFQWGLRL